MDIRKKVRRAVISIVVLGLFFLLLIPALVTETEAAENTGAEIELTQEEKEYLKANPEITIAMDTSWVPYAFLDESSQNVEGIIPNILNNVADRVGLQVKYVAKDTYADALKAVQSKEAMLVSGVANDTAMAQKNNVSLTDPYITINYSSVTKKNIPDLYVQGASYRVAVCVGSYSTTLMKEKMPSYEFVEYHNNDECMAAVDNGEVDIALLANQAAEYFNGKYEYTKLNVSLIDDFSWGLCFGINKDCAPVLTSILNKGIAALNDSDVNQASYRGLMDATQSKQRIGDWIYQNVFITVVMVLVVILLLGAIVFLIVMQRYKLEEVKTKKMLEDKQALEEKSAILKASIQNADISVWSYEPDQCCLVYMEGAASRHGFLDSIENFPESLIQKGIVHPDYAEPYRRTFAKVIEDGTVMQGEFLLKDEKGENFWWERAIFVPMHDEKGTLTKIIVTFMDITDQKEKETKYIDQINAMAEMDDENLLAKGRHNLSENVVQYYFSKNSTMNLKEGSTYDDAVAELEPLVIAKEDFANISQVMNRQKLIEDYKQGKREGSIEYRRYGIAGHPIWTCMKYVLYQEPSSEAIIAFLYSYDVTERVMENQIIAKLSNLEYEVVGLLDPVSYGYQITSIQNGLEDLTIPLEGNLNELKKMKQTVSGIMVDEEERKSLSVEYIVEYLESHEIYQLTYSSYDKENKMRQKRLQCSYLNASQNLLLCSRTDITDIYLKEQKQIQQIENALKEAKNANSAKTEFFSRMSHDMRTPMNGILGLAALSADEENMEILKENISKIGQSGEYLLGLINDTLDFQKIEAGRMTIEPQIIYSEVLLDNIIDMVKQTAENKGVNLRVVNQNAKLNCYVNVDPLRMKQIFVNLLSNAVKFTPKGGTVELVLECTGREGMVSHDLVKVRDTGIGMSEDFIKNKIFTPFVQERNELTANYAGSGLGLSIAKKLVELMNGTIQVESELGAGTTFTVQIDFERVDEKAVLNTEHAKEKQKLYTMEALEGRRILLVEDNSLNAEIAARLLEKAGCEVIWKQNGELGVREFRFAQTGYYDAVLMDIRMPVMDGITATKNIRCSNKKDAKTIPIIAMTANAYDTDIQASYEAGMNEHLAKPISPQVLYEALTKCLLMRNEVL